MREGKRNMTDIEKVDTQMPLNIDKMINDTKLIMEAFNKVKNPSTGIISRDDMAIIQGNPYIKKKGWTKIARFFSITTKIEEVVRETTQDGNYIVRYRVSATCPWIQGKEEDIGIAEKKEFDMRNEIAQKKGKSAIPYTIHNVETLAYARAYNRVISKLIGGGELSAEEISVFEDDEVQPYKVVNNRASQKQLDYIKDLASKFKAVVIEGEGDKLTSQEADQIIREMNEKIARKDTNYYEFKRKL